MLQPQFCLKTEHVAWAQGITYRWGEARSVSSSTHKTCNLLAGLFYDQHHSFTYGSAGSKDVLPRDTFFVNLNGDVPCCITSSVPSAEYEMFGNGTERVPLGQVLGSCNPTTSQANITWLGQVYVQDISQAKLLTMTVRLNPGTMSGLPASQGQKQADRTQFGPAH